MGVDDVERRVLEIERVDVTGRERDVDVRGARRAARSPAQSTSSARSIPTHPTGRDTRREVERDRSRPAPDVEEVEAGLEPLEEVAGRVRRGPPLVAAQHRLVVPVRVGVVHAPIVTRPLRSGRAQFRGLGPDRDPRRGADAGHPDPRPARRPGLGVGAEVGRDPGAVARARRRRSGSGPATATRSRSAIPSWPRSPVRSTTTPRSSTARS